MRFAAFWLYLYVLEYIGIQNYLSEANHSAASSLCLELWYWSTDKPALLNKCNMRYFEGNYVFQQFYIPNFAQKKAKRSIASSLYPKLWSRIVGKLEVVAWCGLHYFDYKNMFFKFCIYLIILRAKRTRFIWNFDIEVWSKQSSWIHANCRILMGIASYISFIIQIQRAKWSKAQRSHFV